MTFHKSATDFYSGLHLRFYLKSDNICLYDLSSADQCCYDLKALKNIGTRMVEKLNQIGIYTSNELNGYSTEEIICNMIENKIEIDYITIYSIEGAKNDLKISDLSKERKRELKLFFDMNKHIIS